MTFGRDLAALASVRRVRAERAEAAVAAAAAQLRRDEAAHAAAEAAICRHVADTDRFERDWLRRLQSDVVPQSALRARRCETRAARDAEEALGGEADRAAAEVQAGRDAVAALRAAWRAAVRACERIDTALADIRRSEARLNERGEEDEGEERAIAVSGACRC